jgi:DNA-binding MarR family transcriptional regulator
MDSGPDEMVHQPLRLRIMAALNTLDPRETVEFTQLRTSVRATDGNLGAHLATLERAGYISVQKDFVGKRPRTRVAMTVRGRGAFARHVDYLREVIEAAGNSPGRRGNPGTAASPGGPGGSADPRPPAAASDGQPEDTPRSLDQA